MSAGESVFREIRQMCTGHLFIVSRYCIVRVELIRDRKIGFCLCDLRMRLRVVDFVVFRNFNIFGR